VMPHWLVTPDADGLWKVTMRLNLERFSRQGVGAADRLEAVPG